MQSTPLTLATRHHVTQAATLCPKVDNFLHNTSWIYGNSPPARRVPFPNFDVSAASLLTQLPMEGNPPPALSADYFEVSLSVPYNRGGQRPSVLYQTSSLRLQENA